jgi:large subunit ribosomal protein L33
MAKKSYMLVRLVPEEQPETGTVYTIKKSTKGTKTGEKFRFRKFDPVLKKHVWFVEKRMPSHSK